MRVRAGNIPATVDVNNAANFLKVALSHDLVDTPFVRLRQDQRSKADPAARIAALTADFVVAVESNERDKGWEWPHQEFSHFEDRTGADYSIVGFEDQIGVQRKADDLVGSLFGEKAKSAKTKRL